MGIEISKNQQTAEEIFYCLKGKKMKILAKFLFKLTELLGSPFSLVLHTVFIAGFFYMRYLGLVSNLTLLSLATIVSIEALYLAFFNQIKVKRQTSSLSEATTVIENMREEEQEIHKLMVQILYLAHQMKTLQNEVAVLKRNGIKHSGNGHRIHATS